MMANFYKGLSNSHEMLSWDFFRGPLNEGSLRIIKFDTRALNPPWTKWRVLEKVYTKRKPGETKGLREKIIRDKHSLSE